MACAAALLVPAVRSASAQGVIDQWRSVQVPPPPELKPVTVDPANTALLVLDMYATSCNQQQRPSCVPTIPHVQKLLADARSHHMKVIYTAGPAGGTGPAEPLPALARQEGEPTAHGMADKFMGSDLEKLLKDANIKTIITVGTSADAAVLYTGSHAAFLGYDVIIPVDGISSETQFPELYTVWHMKNTVGQVSRHVTLTKTDLITYK
jgi:nicotinamidase-related amidase